MSKERMSFSKLKSFEDCPYGFYLNYRLDDDDRESGGYIKEGNYYAENGSLVHEIHEKYFNNELEIDELSEAYLDGYDGICYRVKESTMEKTFELCMNYWCEVDFEWMKGWKVIGVEQEVGLKIVNYDYIGYIDLLLENEETGDLWIIDHKSSAYPFLKDGVTVSAKSKDSFEYYKKQMYLYCHAVKDKYGKFPAKISWNHFKENKLATIDFNESEYRNALKWFKTTVKKIEKETDYEPKKEFFHCANLCDFRNCCEYRKEDLNA